jgi:acyl-CoA synthetase (AMP-forming)/AMP-acid ligase II
MALSLPSPLTILQQAFENHAARTALVDAQGAMTYAELAQQVNALALALREHLGEKPVVVALCAGNHRDHLVAMLAIFMAGHVWVPLNPRNSAALNSKQAQRVRARLVISDADYLDRFILETETWTCAGSSPDLESMQYKLQSHLGQALTGAAIDSDAALCIKFTGGTTGEPKGVIQTQRTIAAVVENLQAAYDFTADDVNLSVAPLSHGAFHLLLPIFAVGGMHRIVEPKPAPILAALQQDCSVSFMPPTLIYKLMAESGVESMQFPKLRQLIYSAAPMPPEKIRQAQQIFGPVLATFYGQVEAPVTITALNAAEMADEKNLASVGRPCFHAEVRIDGAANPGESGEILARGAMLMAEYFEAPEKTAETIDKGWLRTGDIGYLDERGYLFINGRAKEMIISGGFNIYPGEVEKVVSQFESVAESLVFGVDDEYWGEHLEAALVAEAGQIVDQEAIAQALRDQLGAIYVPKRWHMLEELPRNPVGKVVRREVKQLLAGE